MSIATFIRDEVLRPRLEKAGALVVYDPEGRYRSVCRQLECDDVSVLDVNEGSIACRKAATMAFRALGRTSGGTGLLVYVPSASSASDSDRQLDPFASIAEGGAVFPRDDGDDFLSICLRAKPDHATEIRRVFANAGGNPSFAVIDAIGGGAGWPQLRSALRVDSPREIIEALLAPTEPQADRLKQEDGWADEAREFLLASIGLTLKTKGKTLPTISQEVWRFVLFSEFVFDLPGELPESLRAVPRAPEEAKPVIMGVCERLRSDVSKAPSYIERAEAIESELDLRGRCEGIEDFGERETFPFEERVFLRRAIRCLVADDLDGIRGLLKKHSNSVWRGKGESQTQWEVVRSALALVEACDALSGEVAARSRTQLELIDFYLQRLREADRLHREFEQAVSGLVDLHDVLPDVITHARARYRKLAEKVQVAFMRHLESSGWPPSGRMANADVFDKLVADRLKETGRKVAYMMVDALRYELGLALERMLAEEGAVEMQAAYAQLPTVTPVGMASLLPGARTDLALRDGGGTMQPTLGTAAVTNVAQRMDVLRRRYGDRFQEIALHGFVTGRNKIGKAVDLLVLRSTEIDSHLESNPETALSLIPSTLKQIRVAVHKLRALGFEDVVIAADHGFFLNASAEAGDVCGKPAGSWPVNGHDRMLLGTGTADVHSAVVPSERLGIRGDFPQAAMPRSMAPYRAGKVYFHGGASLAESVVPVLTMRLVDRRMSEPAKIAVSLGYKNGAKRITTRVPVVDMAVSATDMFAGDTPVQVLLEAYDAKGNLVGEAKPSADVDHASRTITLLPGEQRRIAMSMDPDFQGKFTVKAIDPGSQVTYATLDLQTDYME